jgi:flagellum-specific peptidoglycan hydrolase FlgJ
MRKITIAILLIFSCLQVNNGLVKDERYHIIFSEQKMISYAKRIGIKYIDVMVAQSRLETGNYTSKVFREGRNLFGMKLPERRETTAVGEHRNHAKYTSWVSSVDDYKIWQSNVLAKVRSKKQYLAYIGKNYAENPKYLKLIKKQL